MAHLFVERLTNIDFSYLHPDRGLLGESWLLDVELKGALDEQGMVLDFGIVKRRIKDFIDTRLDHCLVVPANYSGTDYRLDSDRIYLNFQLTSGATISQESPASAVSLIPTQAINIDSVKAFLLEELRTLLPDNIEGIELELYLEPGLDGSYQYSHGLRKHDGNCQRIAHGHRSRLEIYDNNERSERLEKLWFERWKDIYIGTDRHLVAEDDETMTFAYEAPQGQFKLTLPKSQCYLIDTESTVENIAAHLALETARIEKGTQIKVRAFEGVAKGAIAHALCE